MFGLAGGFETSSYYVVSVADLLPVPDEEYTPSESGTAWSSKLMAKVASEALKRSLGLLLIHSHSFSSHPSLSRTDELGFRTLAPRLKSLIPFRPHGSLVLGEGRSVGGLVSLPRASNQAFNRIGDVRWTENPIQMVPPRSAHSIPFELVYDRQELLIGQVGQRLLRAATIGVVGLGGGGSHLVQQAAHAGIGTLVLVDDDTIEASNLARLVGAEASDISRRKTEVMTRLVARINPSTTVLVVNERFPSARSIRALSDVDVVVSCVDTLSSRVELQKFGWRYLLPVVDIGIGTRLAEGPGPRRAQSIAGHVHVYLPGGPCMWCSGLLSQEKLSLESAGLGPEYVVGAANPAQVVSFNGVVASMAVTELMQLVTGFMARSHNQVLLQYDVVAGEMYSLRVDLDHHCPHDTSELGMGDPIEFASSSIQPRGL